MKVWYGFAEKVTELDLDGEVSEVGDHEAEAEAEDESIATPDVLVKSFGE